MRSHSYPFSSVEEKWKRQLGGSGLLPPAEELGRGAAARHVAPWPLPALRGLDLSALRRLCFADTLARFERHRGRTVFFAQAIDGFAGASGDAVLPPPGALDEAVAETRAALEEASHLLGLSLDPETVPATSDPAYYRFTQWLFLELLGRGLVYRLWTPLYRCNRCEEDFRRAAPGRRCPRCAEPVVESERPRWMADITPFAERLLGDVEKAYWPRGLRKAQRHLIGRRRGTEVWVSVWRPFDLEQEQIPVFTTRIEAIYGMTCLLVAPHHELLEKLVDPAYREDVERYQERWSDGMEPRISGVRTGGIALNPASLERVPVLVSPVAITPFSDGIVLGIPAHDRDQWELARRLKLRVREVIHSDEARFDHNGRLLEPHEGDGVLTNSGPLGGLATRPAREKILTLLSRRGICRRTTRYALRGIPLSSPGPWGPPVPLVHCDRCGTVPVPEQELPLHPPPEAVTAGRRGGREDLLATVCPRCGERGEGDPHTILPWLGAAWNFLRLLLPELGGPVPGLREDFDQPAAPRRVEAAPPASERAAGPEPAKPPEPAETISRDLDVLPEDRDIFAVPEAAGEPDAGEAAREPRADAGGTPHAAGDVASAPPPEDPGPEERPAETASSRAAAAPRGPGAERRRDDFREPPGPDAVREAPAAAGGAMPEEREKEKEREKDTPPEARSRPRLRPFYSPYVPKLMPVDIAVAPGEVNPVTVIACRFLYKALYDDRQVPCYEPFRACRTSGAMLFDPADEVPAARAAPAPEPGPQESGAPAPPRLEAHGPAASDSPPRDPRAALCRRLAERFGSDALRVGILLLGPPARPARLSPRALYHAQRFLDRAWRQITLRIERGRFVSRRVLVHKHRLIHEVSQRLQRFSFHTALSSLMSFVRFLGHPETTLEEMDRSAIETFLVLLEPFAPCMARELWERLGRTETIGSAPWPTASDELIDPPEREFAILVNGRVRDHMVQPSDLDPAKLESRALGREAIRTVLEGRRVERVVVVPKRLVWIVACEPAPPK